MEKASGLHQAHQQGQTFQVNLCYAENSFKFLTFKNCSQSLILTQLQAVILEHTEV